MMNDERKIEKHEARNPKARGKMTGHPFKNPNDQN